LRPRHILFLVVIGIIAALCTYVIHESLRPDPREQLAKDSARIIEIGGRITDFVRKREVSYMASDRPNLAHQSLDDLANLNVISSNDLAFLRRKGVRYYPSPHPLVDESVLLTWRMYPDLDLVVDCRGRAVLERR
jgi:hypothetical protein